MSFYSELKRRNVFKVAIVYGAIAWLLLQVSDTLGPALHLPEWFVSGVAFLLILGFPIAIILAWAFELTPEGLRTESNADGTKPAAADSSKKLNHIVVSVLVLSLGYFAFDKFVLDPGQDAADIAAADQQQVVESELIKTDSSIAVLPFVNMSSDVEQEYFSDGLSEELLNLLARIPELDVAARTSSFSFKDKDLEVTEIGSRLNVAHVLEGSVRKDGDQMRITVQLIQADNGYHLWSETYDRKMDSVFEVQEEIANAVVEVLRITLLGEAPKIRKTDPAAYQLFLEGQYLKRQLSSESLNRAVDLFQQAIDIDPEYVPALAELADTYIWGGGSDKLSLKERRALADQAIETAIRVNPDYAYAYYVRGIAAFFSHQDFEQGVDDFQHALELDPDNAFLVAAIGKGALLTGRIDLAITQYHAALTLEPVVPEFHFFLGRAYLSAGRFDDAEASFRKLSSLSSSAEWRHYIFLTLYAKGDLEAALAEADSDFERAIVHYALGNFAAADEAFAELMEYNSNTNTNIFLYGHRGEADKTFEWLDVLIENGDYFPNFILTDTAFHSVHSDARWEPVLEELGLLEYWQEMPAELKH